MLYILTCIAVTVAFAGADATKQDFNFGLKFAAFDTANAVFEMNSNTMVVFGSVSKSNERLLVADKPWEMPPLSRMDNGYPNIIFDSSYSKARPWRLWYDCCIRVKNANRCSPSNDLVGLLYAESVDGINWIKPSVGRINFQDSKENNIVLIKTHGLGVMKDTNPAEPPSRRYKAFGMAYGSRYNSTRCRGVASNKHSICKNVRGSIFTSADGINWDSGIDLNLHDQNRLGEEVFYVKCSLNFIFHQSQLHHPSCHTDTHQNFFYDSRTEQYVWFTRGKTTMGRSKQLNRTIARFTSKAYDGPYSNVEVVHAGTAHDQLYEQLVFPYWSVYLGFVVSYDFNFERGSPHDRTRCELAWSPDSVNWHRLYDERRGTREIIPLSKSANAPDGYDCYPANRPVDVAIEHSIRLYYFGGNGPHFGYRNSTLMLARLRRDGFAGLTQRDPLKGPAVVTSRPLPCNGEPLSVTTDVEIGGSVDVTLLSLSGPAAPIVSLPIRVSGTDRVVEFPYSGGDIPAGTCKIIFKLHMATLYTFGWPHRDMHS